MARPIEVLGDPRLELLPGAFPSSLEPKAILSSLAERTSQILNATRCSVVRVDPSRHPGKAFVFTAIDDPSIEGYTLDLEDYPEIRAALERNAPILMRDLPDDEVAAQIRARHRRLPFPVSLAIPLSYAGESFGVLFLRFSDPHQPISREAVMFCQLIAFGAAVALHNARQYEQLLAQVEYREQQAQTLADANRMQLETLSAASHDIRVPLNSIIGYTDLLLEGLYGEVQQQQKEVLERILENAQNLLEIVNTLIDYARLEEGRVPLELSRGEVATLFEDLRVVLEPLAQRRDLELSFQICGAVPLVQTDWPKLKRILLNLLHNAVKFTERGRVSLTAMNRDGRVEFEVADTGVGIPPEHLSDLFSQWTRVAPRSAAEPGGLGLAIAKRYTDLLRGRLSVASELGKGTRFSLSIPVEWEGGEPG
jgi:signal transduction histidine kinase